MNAPFLLKVMSAVLIAVFLAGCAAQTQAPVPEPAEPVATATIELPPAPLNGSAEPSPLAESDNLDEALEELESVR